MGKEGTREVVRGKEVKKLRHIILVGLAFLLLVVPACTCKEVDGKWIVGDECFGDVIPCANMTYSLGDDETYWLSGYINALVVGDDLFVYGDGEIETLFVPSGDLTFGDVNLELRPDLDYTRITAQGKPTQVFRGIFHGYSLPVYAAGEELFLDICIPDRWNGTSDILFCVDCYIDTANDNKNFNLQLDWEHYTPITDIVPNTSNPVTVETNTGAGAAAFQSYHVEFVIDYNIDVGDDIEPDDNLALRLRRIAATASEIAGEIVILHVGVVFRIDKVGDIAP